MSLHGPIRSMADGFYYHYAVCLFCKRLVCRNKECNSPSCVKTCSARVTGYNTNFKYVCANCYGYLMDKFEQQFPRRRALPVKIHTEDDDAA